MRDLSGYKGHTPGPWEAIPATENHGWYPVNLNKVARAALDRAKGEVKNDLYVIWSNRHRAWWRPDNAGYVTLIEGAGTYSRADAINVSQNGRDGWHPKERPEELPVRVADLPDFARTALSRAKEPNE